MSSFVLDRLRDLAPVMRTLTPRRGRQRLHVMPTTAGYEIETTSAYDWDGRRRGAKPFTVLQHTISGAGWLRFERTRLRVTPGQTFILTVPHDHRYWLEAGGRWEFFWISMNGQEAMRVHRSVQAAAGPVIELPEGTIEHLASCCLRLVEAHQPAPGAASALAYEALMALHDGVFGAAAEGRGRLGRALDAMREPRPAATRVAELASAAGWSRAHFSRAFRSEMGEPPARYLRAERLRKAAALLAGDSRVTVKQAANSAGYADPSQFAKAFGKQYGVAPSEYRRRTTA